jgi:hypothetical protein
VHLTTQSTACHSTTQLRLDKKQTNFCPALCSDYRAITVLRRHPSTMMVLTIKNDSKQTQAVHNTGKNRSMTFSLSTYGMRMHVEYHVSPYWMGCVCTSSYCTHGQMVISCIAAGSHPRRCQRAAIPWPLHHILPPTRQHSQPKPTNGAPQTTLPPRRRTACSERGAPAARP